MAHGDIDEFRARVENIAAIGHPVLTAKAEHLLGRLIEEWANHETEQLLRTPGR